MVVWNGNEYDSFLDIFNVSKEKFHMVIKKFKKKTNAVLNVIIDEEGRIIHSDSDIPFNCEDKKYHKLIRQIFPLAVRSHQKLTRDN